MKTKQPSRFSWYNQRAVALGFGLVALLLIYPLALRAMFTGSLQQYFLAVVLFIFALNRFVSAAHHRPGTQS